MLQTTVATHFAVSTAFHASRLYPDPAIGRWRGLMRVAA
jgi:hypothetical protein